MDLIQIFTPDLKTVFNHSTGPEAFTYAIIDELDPVMEFLNRHLSISDSDSVKWILLELTANAVAAPVCYLLGRKTGLTREEMLSVMGTSALWPDLSKKFFRIFAGFCQPNGKNAWYQHSSVAVHETEKQDQSGGLIN